MSHTPATRGRSAATIHVVGYDQHKISDANDTDSVMEWAHARFMLIAKNMRAADRLAQCEDEDPEAYIIARLYSGITQLLKALDRSADEAKMKGSGIGAFETLSSAGVHIKRLFVALGTVGNGLGAC